MHQARNPRKNPRIEEFHIQLWLVVTRGILKIVQIFTFRRWIHTYSPHELRENLWQSASTLLSRYVKTHCKIRTAPLSPWDWPTFDIQSDRVTSPFPFAVGRQAGVVARRRPTHSLEDEAVIAQDDPGRDVMDDLVVLKTKPCYRRTQTSTYRCRRVTYVMEPR